MKNLDDILVNVSIEDNIIVNADNQSFGLIDSDKITFFNGFVTSLYVKDIKSIKRGHLKNQIVVTLKDKSSFIFYPKYNTVKKKDNILNDGSLTSFRDMVLQIIPGIDEGYLFYDVISHCVMIDSYIIDSFRFSHPKHNIVQLSDIIVTRIGEIIEDYTLREFKIKYKFPIDIKWKKLTEIADNHKRNLFLEYIESIKWDRIPRINTLLTEIGFVSGLKSLSKNEKYVNFVSRSMFVSVIDRQYNDNIIVDFVPVLISVDQGIGKSSFCQKMGFYDNYHNRSGSKMFYREYIEKGKGAGIDTSKLLEMTNGGVIVEFAEGVSLKSNNDELKALIDRTSYQHRKVYEREPTTEKITFNIFVTTNQEHFLTDFTGNRRYFPVEYNTNEPPLMDMKTDITLEYIEQCWAEALDQYRTCQYWKDEKNDIEDISKLVQSKRIIPFPGSEALHDILFDEYAAGSKITLSELKYKLSTGTTLSSTDIDNSIKLLKSYCREFGLKKLRTPWKDSEGKSVRGYVLEHPEKNNPNPLEEDD